jgi:hypothetical protein
MLTGTEHTLRLRVRNHMTLYQPSNLSLVLIAQHFYYAILSCGAPLLIVFRSVLCSGCFVLIVGVLAMTFLPGIPVVSGLVVVSHSTQCPTHLGASVGKEHPIVAGALH